MSKKDETFTLIEVLVVLLIVSVLAMMTIMKPIGNFYYDVSKVRNLITYGYNYAFASGRNTKIYYYENSNQLQLCAGSRTILTVNLKYSKVTNYPYFKNMEFKACGTVTPTGIIVLKDSLRKNHYVQLIVSLFGSVRINELNN